MLLVVELEVHAVVDLIVPQRDVVLEDGVPAEVLCAQDREQKSPANEDIWGETTRCVREEAGAESRHTISSAQFSRVVCQSALR